MLGIEETEMDPIDLRIRTYHDLKESGCEVDEWLIREDVSTIRKAQTRAFLSANFLMTISLTEEASIIV